MHETDSAKLLAQPISLPPLIGVCFVGALIYDLKRGGGGGGGGGLDSKVQTNAGKKCVCVCV